MQSALVIVAAIFGSFFGKVYRNEGRILLNFEKNYKPWNLSNTSKARRIVPWSCRCSDHSEKLLYAHICPNLIKVLSLTILSMVILVKNGGL